MAPNGVGSRDQGYPGSVEFSAGRVLTVYWFNQENPSDLESDVHFLAGTFYRPWIVESRATLF